MVRRVASLHVAGKRYTKNMYRREWRQGGLLEHDTPISVDDAKQQLVIALMQKKVSEVLQHERFNNSFQMGMLSSFESFMESVSRISIGGDVDEDDSDNASGITMSDELRHKQLQGGLDPSIRQGVDTQAIERVVKTYKRQFGEALPHPKLDVTADNLGSSFATGDKTLVFVRRVATVHELAAKVDAIFDQWIEQRFRDALPKLGTQLDELFELYQLERTRRPNEPVQLKDVDVALADTLGNTELEPEDQSRVDTFFSWFFRGEGIDHFQSASNYRRSRFSRNASLANFFKDNQLAFVLGYPDDVKAALLKELKLETDEFRRVINHQANRILQWQLEKRDSKVDVAQRVDRHQRFEAAQLAALDLLSKSRSDVAPFAARVADLQYRHLREGLNYKPESLRTISADEFVVEKTLYSVMAHDYGELLSVLLPDYAFISDYDQDEDFEHKQHHRAGFHFHGDGGMVVVDRPVPAMTPWHHPGGAGFGVERHQCRQRIDHQPMMWARDAEEGIVVMQAAWFSARFHVFHRAVRQLNAAFEKPHARGQCLFVRSLWQSLQVEVRHVRRHGTAQHRQYRGMGRQAIGNPGA